MNSLRSQRVFMRSMATRRQHLATNAVLKDAIAFLKAQSYDMVIVETAGIGQSDSEIVDLVDFPVYVMTSDFGAQSQLEKIDMLDFAECVVLNKFDRRGAEDALRDVRKQWKRNKLAFQAKDEDVPVYPTIASQFNDPGVSWMFQNLMRLVIAHCGLNESQWQTEFTASAISPKTTALIPGDRTRYLADIAAQGRHINHSIADQADSARQLQHCHESLKLLQDNELPELFDLYSEDSVQGGAEKDASLCILRQRYNEALKSLSAESVALLKAWPKRFAAVRADSFEYEVRGKTITGENYRTSLSGQKIPKISPPKTSDLGDLLLFSWERKPSR